MSEPTVPLSSSQANASVSYHAPPSRRIVLYIGAVFVLGSLLAVWSIRGGRRQDGRLRVSAVAEPAIGIMALSSAQQDAARKQGPRLHQEWCVGCHARQGRGVGPSYADIQARYQEFAAQDPSHATTLARLVNAVGHPAPGWENYPPGPASLPTTPAETLTLAYWIDQGAGALPATDGSTEGQRK